ncbi:MAG TPA: hypothetical protein VFV96_14140 [Verrucomicrobiae bacterium]|nr:hypothetical protein [Verrucomicrobiae bacterium]
MPLWLIIEPHQPLQFAVPRAPKELPVTALIGNAHGVAEWKLFLNE